MMVKKLWENKREKNTRLCSPGRVEYTILGVICHNAMVAVLTQKANHLLVMALHAAHHGNIQVPEQ